MTDKELIENAAKAAGLESAKWDDEIGAMYWPHRSPLTNCHLWNPLTDDGDALRLAVSLKLTVDAGGVAPSRKETFVGGNDGFLSCEPHGADPFSATRRAIVRAAAAIGKDMQ